MHFSKD